MPEEIDGPPVRAAMEKWSHIKPPHAGMELPTECGIETVCTHLGEDTQAQRGAASPPIYQTSTFIYPDPETFAQRCTPESRHYDYSRTANPTNQILEAKLARLEHAEWADCFGSGMAAITGGDQYAGESR